MWQNYLVEYSDDDLEWSSENMYLMLPTETPKVGQLVIKQDGIYEIIHIVDDRTFGNKWQIFIKLILTQCVSGDIIGVHSKEKLYKCEENSLEKQIFRRTTVFNILSRITDKMRKHESILSSVVFNEE